MTPRIVVDIPALLAALLAESSRDAVLVELAEAEEALLSSCCALETSIFTTSQLGATGRAELDRLLDVVSVEVVAFTADHAALAAEAWCRFGAGRHPAGLNILDCCSHALAESRGLPLLAVGEGLIRTEARIVDLALAGA